MAVGRVPEVFLVLVLLWLFSRGDAEVCVVLNSCVLLCSFQPGDEVVVHWILESRNKAVVHSYYYDKDQLTLQDSSFTGRTSLFKNQISSGNASLRLADVSVRDRGKYKCYTGSISGNKETFINLEVEAPVREVNIQQEGNRLTCSSEGIYPKPELTWTTSPPSTPNVDKTTVHQTEQQLFSISSSLTPPDEVSDVVYSCSITSGSSTRRASLFRQAPVTSSSDEATIPCRPSNTPLTDLTWRFNHSQVILRRSGLSSPPSISEPWRKHVKSLAHSGNLTLQDLSSKQEGVYTCELRDTTETRLSSTALRVEDRQDAQGRAGIAVGVVVIIAVVIIGLLYKFGHRIWSAFGTTRGNNCCQEEQRDTNPGEETNMNSREESVEEGQTETEPDEQTKKREKENGTPTKQEIQRSSTY